MPEQFRTLTTPVFDRDARRIGRRNPKFPGQFAQILAALEEDPYNINRKRDIKKLANLKPGQGQWRVRFGNYRLRYDIFGRDVVYTRFATAERPIDPNTGSCDE